MTTFAIIGALAAVACFLVWLAFRQARKRGEAEGVGRGAAAVERRAAEANAIEDSVGDLDPDERERLLARRD